MNASAYYQMHQAIESIIKLVRHEMYTGKRGGTIPPSAIEGVADEIRMQVGWLDAAQGIHDDEEPPNWVYPVGHPDRVEDEEPLTHRVRRTRPPYSWEEMEVDDSQYTE